jgi:putative transposase
MPQSFVQIYVHMVFHTKNNIAFIREETDSELYSYMGGILRNCKSIPIKIGGTADHIHILCTLPKTMALSDLMEEVKKSSSKWIKSKGDHYRSFYWQDGYGGFSVSKSAVDIVSDYISNQKKHHCKMTAKVEYMQLLEENGVEFDERYI